MSIKAIVACVCGTRHEIFISGGSVRCQCGRLVLVTDDANVPGNIRALVETEDDQTAPFEAPEVVGWRFTKRGRKQHG